MWQEYHHRCFRGRRPAAVGADVVFFADMVEFALHRVCLPRRRADPRHLGLQPAPRRHMCVSPRMVVPTALHCLPFASNGSISTVYVIHNDAECRVALGSHHLLWRPIGHPDHLRRRNRFLPGEWGPGGQP